MKKEVRRPDGSVEVLTGSPEEIRRYEDNDRIKITVEPVPQRITDATDVRNAWPVKYDDQGCLVAAFFRDNPKAKFCHISCPCTSCAWRSGPAESVG